MKRENFEIRKKIKGWYVRTDGPTNYLFDDGVIRDWHDEVDCGWKNKHVYFQTKEKAEQAIANYLRGEIMADLDSKIQQADADIQALKAEKDKLIKQREDSEKKYTYGDWFKSKFFENRYRLCQTGFGEFKLISEDGNRYSDRILKSEHTPSIFTLEELKYYSNLDLIPIKVKITEVP